MGKLQSSDVLNTGTEKDQKSLVGKKSFLHSWVHNLDRINLLRWSSGFFSITTLLLLLIGLQYLTVYSMPHDIFAFAYTCAAYISHFASITLILWSVVIIPLILLFPYKKMVIPFCVLIAAFALCLELLDSQVYTAHRFHFNLLTIRILGWKTWGFGIVYLFILLAFNSFIAQTVWKRFVVARKRLFLGYSISSTLVLLLLTHATHVWADATGYVEITRFTTTIPFFYPSTDKKLMVKHGFADISDRREIPGKFKVSGEKFYYPRKHLEYASAGNIKNILIIAVDAMRFDVLTEGNAPQCLRFARESGTVFTNHCSGGNSTKMGAFSLFYGIPPTYQQYIESHKRSPVLIDRLQESGYALGIFTSYKLYAPACLDVSAFVNIPDLRLETKVPDPQASYRNDSSITAEWKTWLDNKAADKPFFGFLFYDALCSGSFPASYENRVHLQNGISDLQKKFTRYKVAMQYTDSLIGSVIEDLTVRGLLDSTAIIITADHGEEFDDNHLGYSGHGSSFSDYQIRVPLITLWPGQKKGIVDKRTSHYDIVATLMKDVLMTKNPESDFCSGINLFNEQMWNWLIVGSYFNFAIIEPQQVTVQFPCGYFEIRDRKYNILQKPQVSSNVSAALGEVGRFFNH